MDTIFFESNSTGLRQSFNEDNIINENDKLDTLNKTEISEVFDEILEKTKPSHYELLASLMELNTKELYEVVLHEIINYVGLYETNLNQEFLITFAQKAFKINQKSHDAIYKSAKEKEPPNFILNIKIINGKNMEPKDPNGLSDPFCKLYLSSNSNCKYNTTVKFKTLEPVWEEYFSLPVKNPATDALNVQVWDLDPRESVKERLTQLSKVKGFRGAQKFFKDFARTATYCKHSEELIGSTKIPLNTVHSPSTKNWYKVTYKGKITGSVLMKLSFCTSKNKQVSVQEYRHLLRILLAYQIDKLKIKMYSWMGDLLPQSRLIIQQHVSQSDINSIDEHLGQWIEYINIQLLIPVINFQVFSNLINYLVKQITQEHLSEDELKVFWQSTKKILPLWFNFIKMIRQKPSENEIIIEDILNLLQHLQSLNIPKDLDLFTPDIYDWLLPCENTRDIKCTLHDTIVQGALDWYKHIIEKNKSLDSTEKENIKRLLTIIKLLKQDVQRAIQFYDNMFDKKMQLPYSSILYSIYGTKITDICKPFITEVCKNMRSINFEATKQTDNDPLAMGVTLFELYIGIQEFAKLRNTNGEIKLYDSPLLNYHLWFNEGVIWWFEIAIHKANVYIKKAVELDKLDKVHSTVKYSSSAVDTLVIFNQIKVFWQQLAWPDPESSYSFIETIIKDICLCSLNYSNSMSKKVSHIMERNKIFKFTKEWCLVVNNIDHIKEYIRLFVNSCNLTEIMESLAHYKSDVEINRCKKKLDIVINDAVNTVNKTIENLLLQVVIKKLIPEISKFLIKCEKTIDDVNNIHLDSLILYLSENICTINEELNEESFQFMVDIIVEQIVTLTFKLIDENTKKNNPLSDFKNLRCSFHEIINYLRNGNETNYKSEKIRELEELLYLHTLDTKDLIHEYYLKRLQEQNRLKETNEGFLTVKLILDNNVLKVDILNAHRLRPMDSNGYSDPFVIVYLLPRHKFNGLRNPKTNVQKKNLSPIFDASFKIPLTPEQCALKNGIVMFEIHDEDLMGLRSEFISETFVHFKDLTNVFKTDMDNLPQTQLFLSVPKKRDSKVLDILKNRSTDQMAKKFIREIKSKINASTRKY